MNADHLRNLDTYGDDCDEAHPDYVVVNTIAGLMLAEVPRCPNCGSHYVTGPDHRADCPHYEDEMPF